MNGFVLYGASGLGAGACNLMAAWCLEPPEASGAGLIGLAPGLGLHRAWWAGGRQGGRPAPVAYTLSLEVMGPRPLPASPGEATLQPCGPGDRRRDGDSSWAASVAGRHSVNSPPSPGHCGCISSRQLPVQAGKAIRLVVVEADGC